MSQRRRVAVVPAAGRGSRLGVEMPKALVALTPQVSVLGVLLEKLEPFVDHVLFVIQPQAKGLFEDAIQKLAPRVQVSLGFQAEPTGMGDAIFGCASQWQAYPELVICWGDQVGLSHDTLLQVSWQLETPKKIVLPLFYTRAPYVDYMFEEGSLLSVAQKREQEPIREFGYTDVGLFAVHTDGLLQAWNEFCAQVPLGCVTGERNFLPFLPFLNRHGWDFDRVEVRDATESLGINTPEELARASALWQGRAKRGRWMHRFFTLFMVWIALGYVLESLTNLYHPAIARLLPQKWLQFAQQGLGYRW